MSIDNAYTLCGAVQQEPTKYAVSESKVPNSELSKGKWDLAHVLGHIGKGGVLEKVKEEVTRINDLSVTAVQGAGQVNTGTPSCLA